MKYISPRTIAEEADVHVSTVWRWAKIVPGFPKPVKLSPGCTRFEADAWEAFKAKRAELA